MIDSDTVVIIPARLESTRLPRKMLADVCGKPLIQWTYEATCRSAYQVMVATDSQEITDVVNKFGGVVTKTEKHSSGTMRVADIARFLPPSVKYVINVQGDEPEIEISDLNRLISALQGDVVATLVTGIDNIDDFYKSSVVKVVRTNHLFSHALYFSRAAIPWREYDEFGPPYGLRHIGIYAYQRSFLQAIWNGRDHCGKYGSALSRMEKLEQLAWLEAGYKIRTIYTNHRYRGIDTQADLDEFRARTPERIKSQATATQ